MTNIHHIVEQVLCDMGVSTFTSQTIERRKTGWTIRIVLSNTYSTEIMIEEQTIKPYYIRHALQTEDIRKERITQGILYYLNNHILGS